MSEDKRSYTKEQTQSQLLANTTLPIALSAAVPLRIADLKARGGPSAADLNACKDISRLIAEKGDVLLYGGKSHEAAYVFNRLAQGIAVLAFLPGGVTCFGQHWEG